MGKIDGWKSTPIVVRWHIEAITRERDEALIEVERLHGFIHELAEYLDNSAIEGVPAERQLVELESMLSVSNLI